MKKRILWIEDDYYAIKGLFHPLERSGFELVIAKSGKAAKEKSLDWRQYEIIVVDLILPLSDDNEQVDEVVQGWENEEYVGVGIVKWLIEKCKIECPILILSVVHDVISRYDFKGYEQLYVLPKSGLLPSSVKEKIFSILGVDN